MAMDLDELDVIEDDEQIESPEEEQEEKTVTIEDIPDDEDDSNNIENDDFQDNNDLDDLDKNYSTSDDVISQFLQSKGILDLSHIKFVNDDGELEDRTWDSLSDDEKLNIFNTDNLEDESDLDDDEIELLNTIRLNKLTPKEYLDIIKLQGVSEYVLSLDTTSRYSIDDYSDDELYALDLKRKSPELSDEELITLIESAKLHEDLYKKLVDGLRESYKDLEMQQYADRLALYTALQQEQYNEFRNNILNTISDFDSVGTLDLELTDNEKDEIANYILSPDSTGLSYLEKDLQDPLKLVDISWFLLNGENTISSIRDYYNKQIRLIAQANYDKGLLDAQNVLKKVVIRKQPKENNRNNISKSIDDIDDID